MKKSGIVGFILLSVIIALFVINKEYVSEDLEKINLLDSVASLDLDNNTIDYQETTINEDNKSDEQIIKYTNTNNYPITITSNSISLECTGDRDDVELVESNYTIKAFFSNTKDGELLDMMDVKKNKSIYIHIISNYDGYLPESDVTCDYKVNIISG